MDSPRCCICRWGGCSGQPGWAGRRPFNQLASRRVGIGRKEGVPAARPPQRMTGSSCHTLALRPDSLRDQVQ